MKCVVCISPCCPEGYAGLFCSVLRELNVPALLHVCASEKVRDLSQDQSRQLHPNTIVVRVAEVAARLSGYFDLENPASQVANTTTLLLDRRQVPRHMTQRYLSLAGGIQDVIGLTSPQDGSLAETCGLLFHKVKGMLQHTRVRLHAQLCLYPHSALRREGCDGTSPDSSTV